MDFYLYLPLDAYYSMYCSETEGANNYNMHCLMFYLTFYQFRVVKLTSPTLNCVMIAGAVFLGLILVLYTIPIHSTDILPPLCIVSHTSIVKANMWGNV